MGAIRRAILCAGVAVAAALASATPSAAAVTRVPCLVNGPTGLIAAIDAANQAGSGTLQLAKGCTYTLTAADNDTDGGNGLPVLTGQITITGKGTSIARSASSETPEFRILEVAKHAIVSLRNLTLTGGKLTGESSYGGAINNAGTIDVLSHVTIRDNSAPLGGGVFNAGRIRELSRDTISGNHAANGGGVSNLRRIDHFVSDKVSGNVAGIGAGISNGGAIDDLRSSQISDNHLNANGAGGGIANSFGRLNMTDDVVSGNTATAGPQASGGGIDNSGALTLTHSVIKGNVARGVGGGLRNDEQQDAQFVFIVKSTSVSGNTVTSDQGPATGGGIFNDGEMSVTDSVVRANHARTETGRAIGAGIYNGGSLTLVRDAIHANVVRDPGGKAFGGGLFVDEGSKKTQVDASTITENSAIGAHPHGGGIMFAGGQPVVLTQTVVAGNRPDQCHPTGTVHGCVSSGRAGS